METLSARSSSATTVKTASRGTKATREMTLLTTDLTAMVTNATSILVAREELRRDGGTEAAPPQSPYQHGAGAKHCEYETRSRTEDTARRVCEKR